VRELRNLNYGTSNHRRGQCPKLISSCVRKFRSIDPFSETAEPSQLDSVLDNQSSLTGSIVKPNLSQIDYFNRSYQGFELSHTQCDGICFLQLSTPRGTISGEFLNAENALLNDFTLSEDDNEETEKYSYHSRESDTAIESGSVGSRTIIWGCINQLFQEATNSEIRSSWEGGNRISGASIESQINVNREVNIVNDRVSDAIRMIDPKLDNFWPQTSRENYVYQNWLQIWDCARNWNKERDGLHDQILIRDKIISDLKFKLPKENENSQDWEEKMLF